MAKFFSVPGTTHSGEVIRTYSRTPTQVERAVIDPATGATLYTRRVYEGDFSAGLDPEDGLTWSGEQMVKRSEHVDIDNARVTTEYQIREHDGSTSTAFVEMERNAENQWVVARTRQRRYL